MVLYAYDTILSFVGLCITQTLGFLFFKGVMKSIASRVKKITTIYALHYIHAYDLALGTAPVAGAPTWKTCLSETPIIFHFHMGHGSS